MVAAWRISNTRTDVKQTRRLCVSPGAIQTDGQQNFA
jgi:hypothetical protein